MADERDPKISQGYRELGAEEPPRALDAKILAASRRAVDARPAPLVAPTGRRRWYFPVAAAAVIMLAVAVTMQMERQGPDEEVVASAPVQAPVSAEAPKLQERKQFTPDPPAEKPRQNSDAPVELAKQRSESRARSDARDSAAPAAAPPPVAQAAPAPAPEPARREMEAQRPQASAAAGARLMSKVESPDAWLERIAELRKQGKHEEADKALAEFRQRYPAYVLSDEMKAKVEKK